MDNNMAKMFSYCFAMCYLPIGVGEDVYYRCVWITYGQKNKGWAKEIV